MRINYILLTVALSGATLSFCQDSLSVEQQRQKLLNQMEEIAPTKYAGGTVSDAKWNELLAKNALLQEQLNQANAALLASSKQYLISKYGGYSEKVAFDQKQYTDFSSNYFLQKWNTTNIAVKIFFGFTKTDIDLSLYKELNSLVEEWKKDPTKKIVVKGYADQSGTVEKNKQLSKLRAEFVANYLKTKLNVPASSIETLFFGSSYSEKLESELDFLNRRTEVSLL